MSESFYALSNVDAVWEDKNVKLSQKCGIADLHYFSSNLEFRSRVRIPFAPCYHQNPFLCISGLLST